MNFVTFQSVAYLAHVETKVSYDEIGHLVPYFTTNNQIRSGELLQIQNQAAITKDWLNTTVLSICLEN